MNIDKKTFGDKLKGLFSQARENLQKKMIYLSIHLLVFQSLHQCINKYLRMNSSS